jgi:hypothetical protein
VVLYTAATVVHVLVAVLGIGLVGAIPIVARVARRSPEALGPSGTVVGTLARVVQVGLLIMFLTGVLIDVSAAGAFHGAGWFRISVALLVVVAVAMNRTRAALRRGLAPHEALVRVERWGWAAFVAVAVVTLLMRTKVLA